MDFNPEGGVYFIDKPLEWTSFSVVNKVRYLIKHKLGKKKFKVGHAGTLDPLATGLLIICYGKMTKQSDQYLGLDKTYSGSMRLGATRPSGDMETEIDARFPIDHISDEMIAAQAANMIGEQLQEPPYYSAKRIDGRKAYELARKGEKPEMRKHLIEIKSFKVQRRTEDEIDFEVCCSKGTYIRSLVRDFGLALDSGAHMTALRRTAIGEHSIEKAFTIEDFEKAFKSLSI